MNLKKFGFFWLPALCLGFSSVSGAPYTPGSDDAVLERLPRAVISGKRELGRLRQALATAPQQPELAAELARHYIGIGKTEADPRYYGYAQGVLQPWWNIAEPPPDILLLRAEILQNRHQFESALKDLSLLLQRNPHHLQARIAQAVIFQVQARYDEAKIACLKLIDANDALPATACLSQVASLTGQAQKSYELLREAHEQTPARSAAQRLWNLTILADIAERLDKPKEAEDYYRQGLRVNGQDVYLLTAYADFLLAQKRARDVIDLLAGRTNIDALLLRLALAEQQQGLPGLANHRELLKARFAALKMRGDNVHQGDEARLNLYLLNKPQEALALAQANWQAQREPRDARILLAAAVAAKNPEAAQPVAVLIHRTGLEDAALQPLLKQYQALKTNRAAR